MTFLSIVKSRGLIFPIAFPLLYFLSWNFFILLWYTLWINSFLIKIQEASGKCLLYFLTLEVGLCLVILNVSFISTSVHLSYTPSTDPGIQTGNKANYWPEAAAVCRVLGKATINMSNQEAKFSAKDLWDRIKEYKTQSHWTG